DAFFDQLAPQRGDRILDQLAAVIGWHDVHARRQRRFDFFDLLFDAVDNRERVFAVTHHNNAADGLAFAVHLRHAAPKISPEMNCADVFDIDRYAFVDFQGDVLDICDTLDVSMAAHEIFDGGDFEGFAANICIARFDFRDHVGE